MPIPFLILGGATIVAAASRDINKDAKNDINAIYDEIEEMINDTNERAQREIEDFNSKVDANNKEKNGIIEFLIEPFIEEFSKIKNCELRERLDEGEIKQIQLIKKDDMGIERISESSTAKFKDALKSTAILGAFGVVGLSVSGYFKHEKLMAEKSIATGKYEEAKLQREEINNQISAVHEIGKQTQEITNVLYFFRKILRTAYFSLVEMIKQYGCEYKNYPNEQKKSLMLIVDLYGAINSIIIKPIINQDGSFNKELIDNSMSMMDMIEKNETVIKSL